MSWESCCFQIEESLSGNFLLMLFSHFSWKPLGSKTVVLYKRKWKMYLNISAIKTTGMQKKKCASSYENLEKLRGKATGSTLKGLVLVVYGALEERVLYTCGRKHRKAHILWIDLNVLVRLLYFHFEVFYRPQIKKKGKKKKVQREAERKKKKGWKPLVHEYSGLNIKFQGFLLLLISSIQRHISLYILPLV